VVPYFRRYTRIFHHKNFTLVEYVVLVFMVRVAVVPVLPAFHLLSQTARRLTRRHKINLISLESPGALRRTYSTASAIHRMPEGIQVS